MAVRTIIALFAWSAVVLHGIKKAKRGGRKEKLVLAVLPAASVYPAAAFVTQAYWPSLDDVFRIAMMFALRLADWFAGG